MNTGSNGSKSRDKITCPHGQTHARKYMEEKGTCSNSRMPPNKRRTTEKSDDNHQYTIKPAKGNLMEKSKLVESRLSSFKNYFPHNKGENSNFTPEKLHRQHLSRAIKTDPRADRTNRHQELPELKPGGGYRLSFCGLHTYSLMGSTGGPHEPWASCSN